MSVKDRGKKRETVYECGVAKAEGAGSFSHLRALEEETSVAAHATDARKPPLPMHEVVVFCSGARFSAELATSGFYASVTKK